MGGWWARADVKGCPGTRYVKPTKLFSARPWPRASWTGELAIRTYELGIRKAGMGAASMQHHPTGTWVVLNLAVG